MGLLDEIWIMAAWVIVVGTMDKSLILLFICLEILLLASYLQVLYQTAVLGIVFEAAFGEEIPEFSSSSEYIDYNIDNITDFQSIMPAISTLLLVLFISITYIKKILRISLKSVFFSKYAILKSFLLFNAICFFILIHY